jgi:hypothetical protein
MSTTPSKPVYHILDIGVIGRGKCKASLKCPPHIAYSFPAYYYQLQDDELVTPYVGNIDLSLPPLSYSNHTKKSGSDEDGDAQSPCPNGEESPTSPISSPDKPNSRKWKGMYRIPPAGQLQLVGKHFLRTLRYKTYMFCF